MKLLEEKITFLIFSLQSHFLTVLVECAHVERKPLDMMMACGAANPLNAIVREITPMAQEKA